MAECYLGIDVGTGSARAGLFTAQGDLLYSAKRDIALWQEAGDIAEQSSEDIWAAVCASVRDAVAGAGIDPASVRGIGVDATCSLVVVGPQGEPLPVGGSGDPQRNIIVWMDHRAVAEAQRINDSGHPVLAYVGGTISPEMETPKLLWLKENLPESFERAWQFFDLADYLTWRLTGSLSRSICTLTCKWTYLGHERRWDESYFRTIGLGALADEGFVRIGTEVSDGGAPLGEGLSPAAASAIGLRPGTPVGTGLIDAHAGGVGTVGANNGPGALTSRMAYVLGTSACTMASTVEPGFVPGVWGPYFSAMVPGLWLNEGGQSAAGAAIDYLVHCHPVAADADRAAAAAGRSLVDWLADEAAAEGADLSAVALRADGLHVVPDFLGNRSPLADPRARGLIAGLSMDRSVAGLVSLYIAGLCALGYGVRQILRAMADKGVAVDTIVVSGGAGQTPLVRQLLADSTGLLVAASGSPEPVLLGAAVLGAAAAKRYSSVTAAMSEMTRLGAVYAPRRGEMQTWHGQRFEAFEALQQASRRFTSDGGSSPAGRRHT